MAIPGFWDFGGYALKGDAHQTEMDAYHYRRTGRRQPVHDFRYGVQRRIPGLVGPLPDWDNGAQGEALRWRRRTTMAALEAAMEEMADYSEIDVQTTADGIVVLCHDLNLEAGVQVDRTLGSMTYSAGAAGWRNHFHRSSKGRIPRAEGGIRVCKGRMGLNIELKNIGNDTSLPERMAALDKEYGYGGPVCHYFCKSLSTWNRLWI